MKRLMDSLNILTNIAIISVAVCLIYFILHSRHPGSANDLKTGQKISGISVQPSDQNPIIVVALQEGCHFCKLSMPFYRELVKSAGDNQKHMIFVFPQTVETAREYLATNGIDDADVQQKNLTKLGVRATPTLMLLDHSGILKNYWVGALDAERQKEVKSAIHLH